MPIHWLSWKDLPWTTRHDMGSPIVQMCDRLLNVSLECDTASRFYHEQLPEISSEFGAQWLAVVHRTPQWETVAEFGRHKPDDWPWTLLEECLDRESAGLQNEGGTVFVAVPLVGALDAGVLLMAGPHISPEQLPGIVAVGHTLELAITWSVEQERMSRRVDRLRTTLEIATSFAAESETRPLLERIAKEATRFLDCDRATIFLWDRENHQLIGCPALGVEGGTLQIPDNAGIVGETIQSGHSITVDDAYADSRFSQAVDKQSGYRTRNLLCVPLRNAARQLIGVFEVINKNHGSFDTDDEESLRQFGVQAAIALENLKERQQLVRSREQLTEQVKRGVHIVGESPSITALRATIERLAATDLPVLILGESGTGKEVAAQSLHYQGPRSEHPFVAVNCAALAETLLESELFGHEKGAFTDARETRQGKFELAESGTLFLDEIGDMSLGGQAKLLRVLEQKVITRVGGSQSIPINVRVVAATNAKLAEAVREKRFREDLFYRLSVVTLDLPPLRERPEDILPLAEFFLRKFAGEARRPQLKLSAEARRRLQAHSWPGNVRELRNLMERVAFLCPGERIEADDLAFILSPEPAAGYEPGINFGLDQATRQFQRDFIRRAVKRVGGNMSEAARLLNVHRSNLYRKMRQLDMKEVGGTDE